MHLVLQYDLEVPGFEQVQSQHFVYKHLDLFFLEVSEFALDVDALLVFDLFGNDLPLLLELKALVVVLDAPLVSALLQFFLRVLGAAGKEATWLLCSSYLFEGFNVVKESPTQHLQLN